MSTHSVGLPPHAASRVTLRPLCEADETLVCGLYTDPETMKYVMPPLTDHHASRCFHAALAGTGAMPRLFVITDTATGASLGIGGWQAPDNVHRRVEIGAMLLASARNQRYSIEAVAAIIDKAFAELPIDAVWAQHDPAHVAAGRLCDRLGMQRVGDRSEFAALPALCVRSLPRPNESMPAVIPGATATHPAR